MVKKEKLKTPDWILGGYDSEEDYNNKKGIKNKPKEKTFKIRQCPKCKSDDVGVLITGEEGRNGEWECRKCKWKGVDVKEKELTENKFMKYLDDKGEEVG
tara:strand:+ start:5695 stop:5994 length:300 start_codon:yes stop_codon:yes gene_type:complete